MLRLAKYHGLGNDFLLLAGASVDGSGDAPALGPAEVVALCARHTGIGADGVITLVPLRPGVVRMTLRNADGSLAETSGNGLRCAALAALDGGLAGRAEVVIETGGGTATARLTDRLPGGAWIEVSFGTALLGEVVEPVLGRVARLVDTGNPHLVLYQRPGGSPVPPLRAGELAVLEHGPDGSVAGGLNVEAVRVVAPAGERGVGPAVVDLVVWERGAGETLACGSGSVAAAAALRSAGLVGDRVEVRNPGGSLVVELAGPLDAPSATLGGPAVLVARLEVDADSLAAAVAAAPGAAAVASGARSGPAPAGRGAASESVAEGVTAPR